MASQQIVGAIIDSDEITTDMGIILRAAAAGRHVDYISRRRAETISSFRGGESFAELTRAPTLFVLQDGVRFVRRAAKSPTAF